MRLRGFGHICLRGQIYWLKWSCEGEAKYESSHSTKISHECGKTEPLKNVNVTVNG